MVQAVVVVVLVLEQAVQAVAAEVVMQQGHQQELQTWAAVAVVGFTTQLLVQRAALVLL